MFSQHVGKNLSAYCHGELSDEESRRVAEHLIGCQRCRREFEEIKLGVKFAEQLPLASAPASLWNGVESALVERSRPASLRPQPSRLAPVFGWQRIAAVCALLLLVLAAGFIWYSAHKASNDSQVVEKNKPQETIAPDNSTAPNPATVQNPSTVNNNAQAPLPDGNNKIPETVIASRADGQTWEVARLAGTPTIGANQLEGSGRLAVGEWLETDSSSRAKINVADIGQVDIGPNSRVRLVGTRSTEHRLALARGRLHAFINAPPRLFIVETPSATGPGLGCSFTPGAQEA